MYSEERSVDEGSLHIFNIDLEMLIMRLHL